MHLPPLSPPAEVPLGLPVYRSSTFRFRTSQDYADVLGDRRAGYTYSRIDNPTADTFAAAVASLEGHGAATAVTGQPFSSGMAAISSVLLALCSAGSHVVAPAAVYGGTYSLLTRVLARFGVDTTFVDQTDLDAVRAALRPRTALVYAETIANPTTTVADLPSLAALASGAGVPLVVDNTFASPAVCRPLVHGASVVVHSATKFIGGHSDVTGGVAVGPPELMARVRSVRIDTGGALSPDDAFLLHRGLATLPVRVERESANALTVARALQGHRRVARVEYPGLASHPQHELAARLFDQARYGAVVTVTPRGGRGAGMAFCDALRLASVATSLGGVHTVVSHVASTTHRQFDDAALAAAGIDPAAVRISVGLEDAEDLVADMSQALDAL